MEDIFNGIAVLGYQFVMRSPIVEERYCLVMCIYMALGLLGVKNSFRVEMRHVYSIQWLKRERRGRKFMYFSLYTVS